jgi:cellobiose phosphorylase
MPMNAQSSGWPRRFESPAGLAVQVNANGSIRRIEHRDVVLNLFPANEVEGGPTNLYLRALGDPIAWTPLLGPCSPLAFDIGDGGLRAAGDWHGLYIAIELVLVQAAPAWFWHVAVENRGGSEVSIDLVYAQDVALAPYGAIRMNEYYVSQYLDHTPLRHAQHGVVVATRQNMAVGGRTPWLAVGSLHSASSFATDALQLHGLATRAGQVPAGLAAKSLPGQRLQHEHAMIAVQDEQVSLAPGARAERGFFAWFEPDHPAATSDTDVGIVERVMALPEATPPQTGSGSASATRPAQTLFSARAPLACRDLTAAEISRFWGDAPRHAERDGDQLLSFFTAAQTHVVLRAKELRVLRPHGELFRTGDRLIPDEQSLTTTAWMAGVFTALLTQGHVSINRALSTTRSYLGLHRSHGQRLFVETSDGYRLLDVPSAWEVSPSACRWLYAHAGGLIEIRLTAGLSIHALDLHIAVLDGAAARFLLSSHVALNGDDGADAIPVSCTRDATGVVLRAVPNSDVGRRFPDGFFRFDAHEGTEIERVGGDELLFADGSSRAQPFLTVVTAPATAAGFRTTGALLGAPASRTSAIDAADADRFWTDMSAGVTLRAPSPSDATDIESLQEILPWYAHDALIHYLAPRGLEQYSGGGWGTRDVAQGPVDLLLALGRWDEVRDLLLRLFANQNPDGDWPQWFMFFERERGIRPNDSHGDIVFWPLHALAEYLLCAEDPSILEATVPFFHATPSEAERATVWAHVERALALVARRLIPGTNLVAYGHGDWNDSLQPVDPAMRERLCSTWTVILHHETATKLARALRALGRADEAARLDDAAAKIRGDFASRLLVDGELAGFAYFRPDGRIDYMLHPRDQATGIHHRLLPMIHAILADMLTPEQAAAHIGLMQAHLLGADGARLFDRPPPYRGGPQVHFQRAESSSFFGREIGIMYTHAHLRYAAAMAHYGNAEAFFDALRRAHPIGIGAVVGVAAPRQANCYFSSSDAAVADRYDAAQRYADVRAGRVRVEGGWRVYSSGPGIASRLIHESFIGVRRGRSTLGIDPVLPKALDGLRAELRLDGRPVQIQYRIAARGHGPRAVTLNGQALSLTRIENPYRLGGVTVSMREVGERLRPQGNLLAIELE